MGGDTMNVNHSIVTKAKAAHLFFPILNVKEQP